AGIGGELDVDVTDEVAGGSSDDVLDVLPELADGVMLADVAGGSKTLEAEVVVTVELVGGGS
ncbi:hypothetical protein C0993_007222, partial [Termitomyces sp. T159_Od127]